MQVLPPRTRPSARPIRRRHRPREGPSPAYRPCLRWEFGFSCAFCLLHESDLAEHGIEGTGLTGVEHFVPQSRAPDLRTRYANCYYACRFCNGARLAAPNVDPMGRRLLDPCTSAWAEHFVADGATLAPSQGDRDAEYTGEAYDLNDARRQRLRRDRADAVEEALRTLRDAPGLRDRLLGLAATTTGGDRAVMLEAAEGLTRAIRMAARQVERFQPVPVDADPHCRCGSRRACSLPPFLVEQLAAAAVGG